MELSPKQQAVNEIKKANHLLILGHVNPDGDQLGSLLALKEAFLKMQKSVTIVVSDKISEKYSFLPRSGEIRKDYKYTDGKILRIDTKRIPVEGMKWRRDEQFLDIHIETEKNLKFEFIEIINGLPKPDLIITVDTPRLANIDTVYLENEKLFLEIPILNIDHHPGNEYYGTVNLVDLTATSTTEILVSLFEALGIKIDTPDLATSLLTGIITDTDSFRSQNTTPKSLTVAAQLLAVGGRQQEIVKNLLNNKADNLLRLWEMIKENLGSDNDRKILWTKVDSRDFSVDELREAAGGLLEEKASFKLALVFVPLSKDKNGLIIEGEDDFVVEMTKLFPSLENNKYLEVEGSLDDAVNKTLKKIAESLSDKNDQRQVWDVIDKTRGSDKARDDGEGEEPIRSHQLLKIDTPNSSKEKQDAIEEALKSISQAEKDENRKEMESLREVIDRKRVRGFNSNIKKEADDSDIFDDE